MRNLLLVALLTGCTYDKVTVEFTATAATVAGGSLWGVTNGTPATGSFTYSLGVADTEPDAERGDYSHFAGGAFDLSMGDAVLTGSNTPFVEIENFPGADTFRFVDGPRELGNAGGVMRVDGDLDDEVEVWIAITDGSGAAFPDDSLPADFPMLDPELPHTFSVSKGESTILLQFDTMEQAEIIEE